MAGRKVCDPRRVALEAKADKARESFERWHRRLKGALTGYEKARRHVANYRRQLARLDEPTPVS